MLMTDIITKKRDGAELSTQEINFVVKGAAEGSIPDYQLSALLMAIYLNSMSESETVDLTLAMAHSGDMLDLSSLGDKTADKHSTGGVGDKTTLICAPIAAALGCVVAKMSGRGLGHTGGTADKLDSIEGYKTSLSREEFLKNAKDIGICIVTQSGNFAPADKKLYALRDVTSTVESIPLIASSIMSKKLAAGAKNIILDVKFGSGAFMKTPEDACRLAEEMVKIGKNAGRNIAAIVTDMDIPLGRNIGNSLEVEEAIEVLQNKGDERLGSLSVTLAAYMYSLSFGVDIKTAQAEAEDALKNGRALKKLIEAVSAQGGNIKLLTGEDSFEKPKNIIEITANKSGYISKCNSLLLGKAASILGAGRETLDSEIDFSAGIVLKKQYGDYVEKGGVIATAYTNKDDFTASKDLIEKAFDFSDEKPLEKPLIYNVFY